MKKFLLTSYILIAVLIFGSTVSGQYNPHPEGIDYNIEKQELMGKKLKPDSANRLKIRMLVDWGQLDVFAAGGVFSYSQQFAFTPDDASLNLYANGGEVKLISLELNEIARTWPDKAR